MYNLLPTMIKINNCSYTSNKIKTYIVKENCALEVRHTRSGSGNKIISLL